MLAAWEKPSGRDRVLGMWRPVTPRDPKIAAVALRSALSGILTGKERVRNKGVKVAAQLGIKKAENARQITLVTADGKVVVIAKEDIEEMQESKKSAMPDDLTKQLTPFELRDLVAFLASLK